MEFKRVRITKSWQARWFFRTIRAVDSYVYRGNSIGVKYLWVGRVLIISYRNSTVRKVHKGRKQWLLIYILEDRDSWGAWLWVAACTYPSIHSCYTLSDHIHLWKYLSMVITILMVITVSILDAFYDSPSCSLQTKIYSMLLWAPADNGPVKAFSLFPCFCNRIHITYLEPLHALIFLECRIHVTPCLCLFIWHRFLWTDSVFSFEFSLGNSWSLMAPIPEL